MEVSCFCLYSMLTSRVKNPSLNHYKGACLQSALVLKVSSPFLKHTKLIFYLIDLM